MAALKQLSNADESNVRSISCGGGCPGREVIILRGILRGRMVLVAARQGW
jgi:hypothetical protein